MPELAANNPTRRSSISPLEQSKVLERLERQDNKIQQIQNDQNTMTMAMQGIQTTLRTLADSLHSVSDRIGEESEDGQGGYKGTGIMGRTRRNEVEVRKLRDLYHRWIAYGTGVVTAMGAFAVIVWWLIGDKLAIVLK